MKKPFLTLLSCTLAITTLLSQEIKLEILGPSGLKDSVIFGFNSNATIGEDISLGEQNLYGTPMAPFDIRVIQRDSFSYFTCDSFSIPIREIYDFNLDSKLNLKPFDANNSKSKTFEIIIRADTIWKMTLYSPEIDLGFGVSYQLNMDSCGVVPILNIGNSIHELTLSALPDGKRIRKIVMVVEDASPSVLSEATPNDIKMYPNPVGDFLYVESIGQEDYQMEVYNAYGVCEMRKPINTMGAKSEVSVETLAKGMYLVRLITKTEKHFEQLIIKS